MLLTEVLVHISVIFLFKLKEEPHSNCKDHMTLPPPNLTDFLTHFEISFSFVSCRISWRLSKPTIDKFGLVAKIDFGSVVVRPRNMVS